MKKLLLSVTFAVLTSLTVRAQVLSIDECVSLARANYPSVAHYGLLEKVSRLNLSNVAKAWLPQGSVGGQVTWQNDVVTLPDMLAGMMAQQGNAYSCMDKTQYRMGVDVTQQIWDGGRSKASRLQVTAGTALEKSSLDVQLYDVEGRVREIYFSMLLLEERMARTEKSMALVDSTLSQVRAMLANGVAMRSDCDQIEAKLLALGQQKAQLGAMSGSLRRIMEIFIGEPVGGRSLQLPSEEPADSGSHPQMRLFDARLSSIAAMENGEKVSTMPTVGAFASGYYGYPGYNMFENMLSRDMTFNFMVGLKVTWNFSTLYTRRNRLDKLNLQRCKVETDRAAFRFNNNVEITESLGEIAALRDVMRHDSRIVELRRSVMMAAQSQLRHGIIDATALLTKITELELAENDLEQHRIELVRAIYNLNHLRNK